MKYLVLTVFITVINAMFLIKGLQLSNAALKAGEATLVSINAYTTQLKEQNKLLESLRKEILETQTL